jgi:hypothetical protein
LHVAIISERSGTPAIGIMTNKFTSAAELMASVLGAPNYKFAIIDHPVSSASEDELKERAMKIIQTIEELILKK